jgi:MFS family permease
VSAVQRFRESTSQRVFSLAYVDGIGTGIQNVVVGVIIAQRFGLPAAGLVLGLSSLGRFSSPLVFWFMDRHPAVGNNEMHRLFRWSIVGMTSTSLAVVSAAIWSQPWVVVSFGFLWASFNSVSSIIGTSAVPKAINGFGPWSMAGTATGAWLGALVVAGGTDDGIPVAAGVVVAGFLLFQLVEIPLLRSIEFARVTPVNLLETLRHGGKGLVLATLTYGPLVVYQALTLKVASVEWVGWAMVAYAAGAITAIPFGRRLRGFNTFPGVLLLGAVGVGVWMLAINGPAFLLTRFIGGLVLFTAQGRLLHLAYGGDGKASTARLAGSSTGLGLGAAIGAIIAAELADQTSVGVMAFILTAATLMAAGALVVWRLLRTATASATEMAPTTR